MAPYMIRIFEVWDNLCSIRRINHITATWKSIEHILVRCASPSNQRMSSSKLTPRRVAVEDPFKRKLMYYSPKHIMDSYISCDTSTGVAPLVFVIPYTWSSQHSRWVTDTASWQEQPAITTTHKHHIESNKTFSCQVVRCFVRAGLTTSVMNSTTSSHWLEWLTCRASWQLLVGSSRAKSQTWTHQWYEDPLLRSLGNGRRPRCQLGNLHGNAR